MLLNSGWSPFNHITLVNGNFNYCCKLKHFLGFNEDFKQIIVKGRHDFIFNRSRTDINAIISTAAASAEDDNIQIKIFKINLLVPHIHPNDEIRLMIYKGIEKGETKKAASRGWLLIEKPSLLEAKDHVWQLTTTTQLEKPRFIIIGFQTDRKNKKDKDASKFDHINLTNLKVFLNSNSYPYDNLNLDFGKNKYAIAYDMYSNFQHAYYGRENQPLLDIHEFKNDAPLIVIDCSHQTEEVKTGPVDVRIEFQCSENVPPNTAAYCLILHDQIFAYNPLTNEVKKY